MTDGYAGNFVKFPIDSVSSGCSQRRVMNFERRSNRAHASSPHQRRTTFRFFSFLLLFNGSTAQATCRDYRRQLLQLGQDRGGSIARSPPCVAATSRESVGISALDDDGEFHGAALPFPNQRSLANGQSRRPRNTTRQFTLAERFSSCLHRRARETKGKGKCSFAPGI